LQNLKIIINYLPTADIIRMIAGVKIYEYFNQSIKFNNHKLQKKS